MKQRLEDIIRDPSKAVEEKIELAFAVREEFHSEDEKANLQNDVVLFSCLINMIVKENDSHVFDLELLQLYVLPAEAYVNLKDYRRVNDVARGVLDVIRYEATRWEAMEETLPRIMDAVGETIYNHALYELHLHYIRAAHRAGKLDKELAGRVRKMLKLRILLDDDDWLDRLWDKELQEAVSKLISSEDLLKIILRPQIGHLRKDPVEYTHKWENIYYDVEEQLEERFANAPRHMGFCFHYWMAKRELLETEYNITWHNPSVMNPGVMFD